MRGKPLKPVNKAPSMCQFTPIQIELRTLYENQEKIYALLQKIRDHQLINFDEGYTPFNQGGRLNESSNKDRRERK